MPLHATPLHAMPLHAMPLHAPFKASPLLFVWCVLMYSGWERRHCREYFDSSPSGRAMRALLLPGDEEAGEGDAAVITCDELRARGRGFERSESLITVFADWEVRQRE